MRTLLALLPLLLAAPAQAQRPVEYEIGFPNAIHHEAQVSVTFHDVAAGPLEVWMSRSSPGRYALHEFAKNVYQVKAFDGALQLTGLVVTKLDGTAKGGVLAAIAKEKPVPVYFIGVGEKLEDLETFSAREFALALLQ